MTPQDPYSNPHAYQPSYAMAAPARPKRWPWILGAVGLGCAALVGIVALLIGAGVWMELSGKETPLVAAEREMILDAEAVAEWLDYTPDPRKEKAFKKSYFDDSYALEYEYDDSASGNGIYLKYSLHHKKSPSDAAGVYLPLWESTRLGLKIGGTAEMTIEDRSELFGWGDQSRFGILRNGTAPFGNIFIAKSRSNVVYFIVSGVYFEESSAISQLLTPYLEKVHQL